MALDGLFPAIGDSWASKVNTHLLPMFCEPSSSGGPLVFLPGWFFTDLGEQFIQVARKLNPDYAKSWMIRT